MNDEILSQENELDPKKLYSLQTILGGTFLGGPLVAGYLLSENFKALDEPIKARNSVIIGTTFTILLFTILFTIPEQYVDLIPRQMLPIIYTGITWVVVRTSQERSLEKHKQAGHAFYSNWRVAAISLLALGLNVSVLFGAVYLFDSGAQYQEYDKEMVVFSKNEESAMRFYDHLQSESEEALLRELEYSAGPKWEENLEIIKKTNAIEGLPEELVERNKLLMRYCELRLESVKYFEKLIVDNSDASMQELERIHDEIDTLLEQINEGM